ncbi:unnamed protein product [Linum trigynum]|uniref:Uncharacterized protein n=1 Tax=Linum trigynum TaxID=586398 RepID=A0AAV2EXB9_9ROSI
MQRTKQKKPTTLLLPCALSSPTNKPRPSNLASDKLLPCAPSSAASLTATAISSSSTVASNRRRLQSPAIARRPGEQPEKIRCSICDSGVKTSAIHPSSQIEEGRGW